MKDITKDRSNPVFSNYFKVSGGSSKIGAFRKGLGNQVGEISMVSPYGLYSKSLGDFLGRSDKFKRRVK